MEVMCNTTHRKDKWLEHCKKKHAYKFRHNLNISFKMVEVKSGDGPWVKYTDAESSADPSTSQHHSLDSRYVKYNYFCLVQLPFE